MRKTKQFKPLTKFISAIFFVFAALVPLMGLGQLASPQIFTTGSGNFTVPCGVTQITVQVWGGGGAGGNADGNNQLGGGGGSGAYCSSTINVAAGNQFTWTIGAGGQNGVSSGSGGASTFVNSGGGAPVTAISAGGGSQGTSSAANGTGGGAGGTASGATVNTNGNTGGVVASANGPNPSYSGEGATAPGGGGTGGVAISGIGSNGNPGSSPGGGGGGAFDNTGPLPSYTGGNGGAGRIIISWVDPFNSGPSQLLSACVTTTALQATPNPLPGGFTGLWTVSPAGPTFSNNTSPTSTVNNLALDQAYTFTWTVSGPGGCTPVISTVTITTPPISNAGVDQALCSSSFTLAANSVSGFTGAWSVVSGTGTVTTPSSPTSTVTGIPNGTCVTLRWTLTNGACVESDDVVICNTTGGGLCNDDPCGAVTAAFTLAPGAACIQMNSPANATTTTSVPPPGCGNFGSFGVRKDVWYRYGPIGADGTANLTISGTAGDYVNAAIYSGASCTNLTLQSCHQNTTAAGDLTIQETGLTSGQYIYIRVWDYFNAVLGPSDANVALCGNVNTNVTANGTGIDPGNNTLSCAGAAVAFTDLGGAAGTYANNTQTTYTICPDSPGQYVTVTFTLRDFYTTADHLIVLNGSQPTALIIADLNQPNTAVAYTLTSTAADGCLTFIFESNGTGVAGGWNATVDCTPTPSTTNHITGTCTEQNCIGGCLRTLCGTPATVPFQGNGFGIQELNETNNGCWQSGERCSNWFLINPTSAGSLSMNMFVNSGQDQDFLLWRQYGSALQCPAETGAAPLLCNFAGATDEGTGFNDALDASNPAYEPSLQITSTDIANDIYFIINVQTYSSGNSCPQPNVQITFGGTASLGCNPPIPLNENIVLFEGYNDGEKNVVHWESSSDRNVAYYSLERSKDGYNWSYVGTAYPFNEDGRFYEKIDENIFSPFTYYRLKQVDIDGEVDYTSILTISLGSLDDEWVSDLFPNPTSEEVSFQYQAFDSENPVVVEVFNSVSQLVIKKEYILQNLSGVTIKTSELPIGSYQVKISQGDKQMVKKLNIIR